MLVQMTWSASSRASTRREAYCEILTAALVSRSRWRPFRAIAGMKHSAFGEEREWRLLAVTSQTGREVRTRSTASGVVPYMDVVVNARLRVDTNEVVEAPLAKVVVGPAEPAQSKGQIAAVGDLLRSRGMWGFRDVPVVPSKAPFRS